MKWLYERAHTHRDKLFLNELTYGDVLDLTIATAKRLAPHLRGESRIALWAENSVSMAIHLFGLSALGIETVLLNTNLTEREVSEQMTSTGVRILLMSEKMAQLLRTQKEDCDIQITDGSSSEYSFSQQGRQYLRFSTHIDTDFKAISPMYNDGDVKNETTNGVKCASIKIDNEENPSMGSSTNRCSHLGDVEDSVDCEINLRWNPSDDKVFCIINTSATTGKFKSVPVRWSQIEAHVKASANMLGVEEEDNWLVVLPMFHVSGLSIILRTLYNGTRETISEKFS